MPNPPAPSAQSSVVDDNLLASVLHDLRTPLAAMLMWQQAVRQQAGDADLQGRAIDAMCGAACETVRLLDDLRDFTLLRRGRFELHMAPLELERELAAVVAQVAVQVQKKSLTITANHGPDLGAAIGDGPLIRRALTLALDTAIQSSPPASVIQIEAKRLAHTIDIRISYRGRLGAAIAEPRRADDDRGRVPYRGLATALIRAIMESHAGNFRVSEDHPGSATTLGLSFAIAPAPAVAALPNEP